MRRMSLTCRSPMNSSNGWNTCSIGAPSAKERPGDGGRMLTVFLFSGSWWVPVVRGTMAVVFGVLAFTLVVTTLAGVILAFGLYALVDGLFTMAAAIASRTATRDWWILLLQGV